MQEHQDIIAVSVQHAGERIPIIAGTGANSTAEAIKLTQSAARTGAVAALSVVLYYNRPTQQGLYEHFTAIAAAADIPLILYNVPARTAADLGHETVLRLSQVPGITGIKDVTGNIERGIKLLRDLPKDFSVYSGDDGTAAALILLGARGNISVTANIAPALMSRLCAAARAGDVAVVRELSVRLAELHEAMFVEANPIPVKWALQRILGVPAYYRLPLVPLDARFHDQVAAALDTALS